MAEINSLIFDDLEVENDFRALLKQRFAEDDVYELFDREINFVPMDSDLSNQVELPAVTFSIFQQQALNPDTEQYQRNTPFTVEVNVYTSGDSKVLKNRKLCNIIISILQASGRLPHHYCKGLMLQENNEVGTLLDSAYRRVIRMSGIIDNAEKIIFRGE